MYGTSCHTPSGRGVIHGNVRAVASSGQRANAEVDAAVLYVAPGGNCGGASPCYGTVQAALDAASGGVTIKVASGVYSSTGAEVARVVKAVTLAGGYSTSDWSTAHPDTQAGVLDAEGADRRGV